jgi:hypothetical protein
MPCVPPLLSTTHGHTHTTPQILIEASQQLPDGRMRSRCLPLSEKMIGAEGWQAAAVRAVSEELATALPQGWRSNVRGCAALVSARTAWCNTAVAGHDRLQGTLHRHPD